mmetsp:Transcript_21780/g.45972  ORF Transcript_21780/g.45972 Transcript_21780/m.45972 type:complete len:101 (+) Transcript_21780:756-1058(+)
MAWLLFFFSKRFFSSSYGNSHYLLFLSFVSVSFQPGRPAFLKTLRELGVDDSIDFEETIGKTCSGPRHDLICGKGSTSVSQTEQELSVALLDLKPSMLKQ